jgi:hypothetical protein
MRKSVRILIHICDEVDGYRMRKEGMRKRKECLFSGRRRRDELGRRIDI